MFSKQVSFNWGRNVQGVKVGFGGAVTSVGAIQVGLSVDRRVSENVKLGLGVDVAPTGAIMAKLRCVDFLFPLPFFSFPLRSLFLRFAASTA